MIELKDINWSNLYECLELQVKDEQKKFITDNKIALAEDYIAAAEGQVIMAFAIYNDDTMIGFVSLYYDDGDGDFEDSYYGIFKIMIDKRYQRKGYGKIAMSKIIEYCKSFPKGKAKTLALSCNPKNINAIKFYEGVGFVHTGVYIEQCGEEYLDMEL